MEFFTIGVYNSTEEAFFGKLKLHNIDTFCDIRQRRGVRGAKYAFVNSKRLQEKLAKLSITYAYPSDLAPTTEIRALQQAADKQNKELKKERQELGKIFVSEYKNRVLEPFDFEKFIQSMEQMGANRIVLFCVEEHAEACHRSLIAENLQKNYNYKITHL